jgi:hypothetical protein
MRAVILLFMLISLPTFAGELLRLESHTEIVERFGAQETQRRIEGYDQQRKLRIHVAEYKVSVGFAQPRASYMIALRHPDHEQWQVQPLTEAEFMIASAALLSTPKNTLLNRLSSGCHAKLLIGKSRIFLAAKSECS